MDTAEPRGDPTTGSDVVDSTVVGADGTVRDRPAAREHTKCHDTPDSRRLGGILQTHAPDVEDAEGRGESRWEHADVLCNADGERCGSDHDVRNMASDGRPGGHVLGTQDDGFMRAAPGVRAEPVEPELGIGERKSSSGVLGPDSIHAAVSSTALYRPDAKDSTGGAEHVASELCNRSVDGQRS